MMRIALALAGVLWGAIHGAPRAADANPSTLTAPDLGLSVDDSSQLRLQGRPFRGIGVNYYDAFVRSLPDGPHRDVEPGFRDLAAHGIPFARFSAGGYWPVDWGLYQTNRTAHWERLDAVIRAAERTGLGLIPSLFWHPPTLADLAGEPIDQWGQPSSATIAWMRTYTREVVTRYRSSPAIWAWEFGNEINLAADLPNAAQHRPPTPPGLGTPSSRSARDELTHTAFRVALAEFAREVRRHDPHRLILSGNAFPRPTAWHQKHEHSWGRDSERQWGEMLRDDNPDPIQSVSGRLYTTNDLALLPWASRMAREIRKPLVVGELGVSGALTAESLSRFRECLDALDTHQVPLAALWVFDFEGQRHDWNVSFVNDRAPLLKLIAERQRVWNADPGSHPR